MTEQPIPFDAHDPVQVENMRVRLENQLFAMAREIAACGLVPTISLEPAEGLAMGEYNVSVEVRYGKLFYRDPKFAEFISQRLKAQAALEANQQ